MPYFREDERSLSAPGSTTQKDKKKLHRNDAVFSKPIKITLIPVSVTVAVTTATTTAVAAGRTITFGTRTSYRNGQCTSIVFCIVKFFNGMLSFFIVGHFYKTVPFRATAITVSNNFC